MRKNILLLFFPILLFLALSLPHIANAQDDSEFAGGGYGEFGPVEMPGGFDEGGGSERVNYEARATPVSEPYYMREIDKEHEDHILYGSSRLSHNHHWNLITKTD